MNATPAPFIVNDRPGIARAIAGCASAGATHYVPLFQAVHHGLLALAHVERGAAVTGGVLRRLNAYNRPALLLIGDDDFSPTGPDGWRGIKRAMQWAQAVVIHATGGLPEHYRVAVGIACQARRCVMVETGTVHVDAWLAVTPPAAAPMLFLPPEGATHPQPVAREAIQ